jgi:hypothetical protein
MVALCREHHDKADAGAFTRDQLRQLKTKRAHRVTGRFDWMRQDLLLAEYAARTISTLSCDIARAVSRYSRSPTASSASLGSR